MRIAAADRVRRLTCASQFNTHKDPGAAAVEAMTTGFVVDERVAYAQREGFTHALILDYAPKRVIKIHGWSAAASALSDFLD